MRSVKPIAAFVFALVLACAVRGAAPAYQFTNNSTGFTLYGGTSSALTITFAGSSSTLTASAIVYSGASVILGTVTASSFTTSGDIFATAGTTHISALDATGNVMLGGSALSVNSATITLSGIANTGANDFLGYTSDKTIVELTNLDAASLLGIPSSRTVKRDIAPMSGPDAVTLLGKIKVVHYRYTEVSGQDATKPHIGFIAEDVASVFPEGANTVGPKTKPVPSVSDRDLLALLYAVVKEQQREIEKLKAAK